MSKRRDADYLCDIKEAIKSVITYTRRMTFKEFLRDRKTSDAVIRNLEIIGEAAKNISIHLKEKYPKIPWKEFAGLRDKVIHHYFGIKYDVIWKVKEELSKIISQIEEIVDIEVENNYEL